MERMCYESGKLNLFAEQDWRRPPNTHLEFIMGNSRAHKARRFGFASVLAGGFAVLVFGIANLVWTPGAHVATAEPGVLRATLPNGLRVILVRNTLAPVVATSVNYLVGSNDTPNGFPGPAHALEHMMFRGSPGLTADQLANIGSVMGGNFNANTRENLTQFLFTVPSEDIDVALRIEATRMQGLLADQTHLHHEHGATEQQLPQH